jgi:hypothetical protein
LRIRPSPPASTSLARSSPSGGAASLSNVCRVSKSARVRAGARFSPPRGGGRR